MGVTVGTSGWVWLWGREDGCDSGDVRVGVTVDTSGWV